MSAIISIFSFGLSFVIGCPDLTLDGQRMQRSYRVDTRNIPPESCAINECNTGIGRRLLLRFDGAIPNVGTSDLEFGRPSSRDGFVWDACHRHYHYNHFMDYQVFEFDNVSNPEPILEGDKRAFCLRDDGHAAQRILNRYGINPGYIRNTFDCDDQGIHVGYQDVYGRDLECQWIDVTDLKQGNYKMRAEVNPIVNGRRRIDECGSYGNNVVWIEFYTPGIPTTTERPTRKPTPRPSSRPSLRPTLRLIESVDTRNDDDDDDDSDNDFFNNRRFGSIFDRFFRNDGPDCIPVGDECRFSSDCCGNARCYRDRYIGNQCR